MFSAPLRGAAGIFRGAVAARNLWWRFRARKAPVPVISIGNLTVGGNAKTPFTLFLANRLRDQGLNIAIVSRGYARETAADRAILVADRGKLAVDVKIAGDEPAMMARRFNGPIAIARHRIDAIELLVARGPLDAVILDDGFQHVRLRRNLDLVLINRERGVGNGWMLPAGPLREPVSALNRASAAVVISTRPNEPSALSASVTAKIERHLVLHAAIRPHSLVSRSGDGWRESAPSLTGRRVLAVSGLADPSAFHAMLREIEADLTGVLDFPDHYPYTTQDWQEISAAARDSDLVVTTEKDLIKLERFPFTRDSLYALRIDVTMAESDVRRLDDLLAAQIHASIPAADRTQEVSGDGS